MSIPCFLWPLLAGLAGLIIGWLLKEFLYRKLKAQFDGQVNQISDLERQKNDLEGKWSKTNEEFSSLTATHGDLNVKFKDLNSNYLSVSNDYDALKRNHQFELDKHKQQIIDYKRELELCGELKVDFDEKQKELKHLQLKFTEENAKDDTELESLKLKLRELQGVNTQLLEKAELWKSKAEDKSELEALRGQLASEQEKVLKLEATSKDSSELESLNLKLSELQGVNAQLLENAELWKSKAEDKSELEALRGQLASEQEKVSKLEATSKDNSELESLKLKLSELQGVNAQLLEKAELWKSKAEDKSELEALKSNLIEANTKLSLYKENDSQDVLKEQVKALQDENDLLKQKLKTSENNVVMSASMLQPDDLTKIEGIGPKIAEMLNKADINTFADLAKANQNQLQSILEGGGSRYQMHNPSTWARQAALARDGKWEELEKWQDLLDGGVEVDTSIKDDLTKIEGIGPKINELLNNGGIYTFAHLAKAKLDRLQKILDEAGSRYRIHNPSTWAQQSALARDGKWEELKKWQDELDGGVE